MEMYRGKSASKFILLFYKEYCLKLLTFFIIVFFSSVGFAGVHTGEITSIQSGNKNSIQIMSDTYVLVALSPAPNLSGGCSKDWGSRLLLDAGTEWGSIMLSQILSAQARGQSVTIGTNGCVSQSSSNNSWELIDWIKSN